MSALKEKEHADSVFNLQDYADFCDLDDLSVEDTAAVMEALFQDFEITSTQNESRGSSSTQEHNSVAPYPEPATKSEVLHAEDATISAAIEMSIGPVNSQQENTESDTEEEAYCAICMETKPLTDFFNTKFCTHMYCNDCVGSYVTDKVQDGTVWINCAGPGCEDGFLGLAACSLVLPKNVIDRWGDLLCESTIQVKFYCPYKDCSALLMGDDKSSDGEDDEIITQSVCPHCYRMFCAQCRSLWHQGLKCQEVQELGEGDREREDLKLKEVAESSHWKRCPECKYYVGKDEGCNHIICRCKNEFCYSCGAKWKSSHYSCKGTK